MSTRRSREKEKNPKFDVDGDDVEKILQEAKIIARWAKNPFYIS